ncbi:glycosyltransferase [Gulosibacter sediminis]|uniref:glycosyltransferase n=1 Tax=Gulosibacter sediminis TaxID=1729695 RepID=UPI0024ADED36|nr:glycosyltransferase [Gulosibacter sediminis]
MKSAEAVGKIVAIVVSWNGGDETVAALASLVEQDAGVTRDGDARQLQVVAADNHSGDDSVARICAGVPEAEVFELGDNLGYGTAANRAMAAYPADAYVICNQDAVYQPGFIAALADALEGDPRVGAATAQVRLAGRFVRVSEAGFEPGERVLVGHDGVEWRDAREGEAGEELLNSTGNQVTKSGNGLDRGWLQPVSTEYSPAVFGLHGGATMLRASAVAPLGGFDEGYFMYYEDTDLSWRLRKAGWRVAYVSGAVSVHAHAGSSGTESANFVRWNRRNRLRCALRNGPFDMKLRALVRTAGASAKAALRSVRAPAAAPASDHLVLDFTSLPPQLGGVGRYLEGLATGLAELDATGQSVARTYLVKPEHVEHFRALDAAAGIQAVPEWVGKRGLRFVWEQTRLPRVVRALGGTALLSPHYTFPLSARGIRRLVTVHDATFFSDPEAHSSLKRRFFIEWIKRGVRADVQLIAPSAATAAEVVRYAGEPRREIIVAHHGVNLEVFHRPSEAELAAFRAEYGVERWVAFLGTIEPRKRVGELISAHASLPDAPPLLISGQRGWDADAAAKLDAAKADASSRIRELGYLPLEQLRVLLGGADAFVYASIAEGFGLPVLEAMASGAPVITTKLSALPEVGGDAVKYCEPTAASIAAALGELLADAPVRAALSTAGAERAATFTWRRCASIHLDALTH